MARQSEAVGFDPSGGRDTALLFAAHEKQLIAAWARYIARRGLHAGFTSSYRFLPEALQVRALDTADPCWLVHKTPGGDVAVRLWPGVAEIVPTLAEALGRITAAARNAPLAPLTGANSAGPGGPG